MIHTQELMLGNWVEYSTGLNGESRSFPMYVTAIFDDEVYLDFPGNDADPWEVRDEDLLGIPITAELLEKCGFIRSSLREYGSNCFFIGLLKSWIVNGELFLTSHCIDSEFTKINREMAVSKIYKINFIHELQNAYFMLTKKHLEVKL